MRKKTKELYTVYSAVCKPTGEIYVGSTHESPLARWKKDVYTARSRKKNGVEPRPMLQRINEYPDFNDWDLLVLEETASEKKASELEEAHIRDYRGRGVDLVDGDGGLNQTYRTKGVGREGRKKIGEANRRRKKS
jgi:hypothetical protein